MKKLFLILALVCGFTVAAHAQFYFGGTVGLTYTHFKLSAEEKGGDLGFKFLPEVGYSFNDNLGCGLVIGYARGASAFGSFDPTDLKPFLANALSIGTEFIASDLGASTSLGAFRFAPYFRWTFYRTGKLEFFLDAVPGFNFGTIKTVAGDQIDKQGFTTIEVSARPGIAFAVNKNFKLVAKLGGIGYQYAGINDTVQNLSRFGFDADFSGLMFGMYYTMEHRLGRSRR